MLPRICSAAAAALDILYPRGVACALCGAELDAPGTLCAECSEDLPMRSGPACPCCGRSVAGEGRCRMCREYGPAADAGAAAYDYDGKAKELILAYKFNDRTGLRELFAHSMLEALRDAGLADEIDCVVPVPMHWLRKFARGYNQSALLASWIARDIGKPYLGSALTRPVYTRESSRSGSGPEERHRSARKSYRAGRVTLLGQTVLLVDDILTTGATLRTCVTILKHLGARKVISAVAAAVPE